MIKNRRTWNHQLADPLFDEPEQVVEWMGAMQAQDFRMSKWAVGVRMKNPMPGRVEEALRTGKIVRTHILRPTWHYVAGKDLRWMRMLTGERMFSINETYGGAQGVTREQYLKSNRALEKILAGRSLTKEEIGREFGRLGLPSAAPGLNCLLMRAEAEGLICGGGQECHKRHSYVLMDEAVPPCSVTREEALAKLAGAYFRSHSPATFDDFVWWSGLTREDARQAQELIRVSLLLEEHAGREFYIHEDSRTDSVEEVLHLLPPFDEFLISYKDRTDAIPKELYPKAFNNYGIFYPVVMHNGRIVGNWKKTAKKQIEVSWFDGTPPCGPHRLAEAIDRCRRFPGE